MRSIFHNAGLAFQHHSSESHTHCIWIDAISPIQMNRSSNNFKILGNIKLTKPISFLLYDLAAVHIISINLIIINLFNENFIVVPIFEIHSLSLINSWASFVTLFAFVTFLNFWSWGTFRKLYYMRHQCACYQ